MMSKRAEDIHRAHNKHVRTILTFLLIVKADGPNPSAGKTCSFSGKLTRANVLNAGRYRLSCFSIENYLSLDRCYAVQLYLWPGIFPTVTRASITAGPQKSRLGFSGPAFLVGE